MSVTGPDFLALRVRDLAAEVHESGLGLPADPAGGSVVTVHDEA